MMAVAHQLLTEEGKMGFNFYKHTKIIKFMSFCFLLRGPFLLPCWFLEISPVSASWIRHFFLNLPFISVNQHLPVLKFLEAILNANLLQSVWDMPLCWRTNSLRNTPLRTWLILCIPYWSLVPSTTHLFSHKQITVFPTELHSVCENIARGRGGGSG